MVAIGTTVRTPWGVGLVVGYNSMVKRVAVRIDGYRAPRLVLERDCVSVN